MRVLVVTPWFPTEANPGSGIFNLRDVELLSRDHDLQVLHLHDPGLPGTEGTWTIEGGVQVRRVRFSPSRPSTFPGAIRALRQDAASADLVHSMAFPALFPVRLSGLHRKGRPWVHTEHWSGLISTPPTPRARLGRAVLARGLAKPDGVAAVGTALASAVDTYRSGRSPAVVISNHVRMPSASLARAPEERGDRPLRIFSVGNVIPHKGPLQAVDTIAKLQQLGIHATLRWAGTGPLLEAAQLHAREREIADRIAFLGHLDPKKLDRELSRAHVFLLPTAGETFGVALAEALAAGLPVVASGQGGHEEFLPREASRIVRDRDPAMLADAVRDLIEDRHRWTPEEIAADAQTKFSDGKREEAYRELYQGAARAHGRTE